jgi:hypothetical protein
MRHTSKLHLDSVHFVAGTFLDNNKHRVAEEIL